MRNRADFGVVLTELKDRARLTVRDIAEATGISTGTLGGYFAGTHLPPAKSPNMAKILHACGIFDPAERTAWTETLLRLRRAEAAHRSAARRAAARRDRPAPAAVLTVRTEPTTRAPLERLTQEPKLYGRRALLDLLGKMLDRTSNRFQPSVTVLHGIAGCGKSALALAICRRAAAKDVRMWWITVDGPDSLAAGMMAVAEDLGASREQLRLGSSPEILWRLLNSYRRRWLLVIDNADDPRRDLGCGRAITDGVGWIRPVDSPLGAVLVTTRDGSRAAWGASRSPWLALTKVATLDDTTSARLLLDLAGPRAGTSDEAVGLARRLGHLTLALRMAGGYLAEAAKIPRFPGPRAPRTFAEYEHALDTCDHEDGADMNGGPEHWKSRPYVEQTLGLSLDLLTARGVVLAPALLRLLSCFGPGPLPYESLLDTETMAASPLFPRLTDRRLWDTMQALAELDLVTLERGIPSGPAAWQANRITVHPLVRDACRAHDDLSRNLSDQLALSTALLGRLTARLDPRNPECWPQWQVITGHCRGPLDLVSQGPATDLAPEVILRPVTLAARYLRASGNLGQSEAVYASALGQARAAFGAEHPAVLELDHDLCRVRSALGRLSEAEAGFREVLELRSRILGPRHPDTLTTQHYLARALRDSGQVAEAADLFAATLGTRRLVLGEHHHDTLTSQNNLADLLRATGRAGEAEPMLRAVFAERVRTLGAEHPATLVARQYLAITRHDQGDPEALSELRELAAVSDRVLGDDHPRTLLTRHQLAIALLGGHLRSEARSVLRDVLDRRRRVLGERHPATLATSALLDAQGPADPEPA
ncbi:tetratricopeptide repeat protein [Catenulispora yoronensis]|uniref:tetratricopeptide repeat protein n=1 Tax=Catenulispora yoronensis TaxID=450799 RepID=UPI0031DC12B0